MISSQLGFLASISWICWNLGFLGIAASPLIFEFCSLPYPTFRCRASPSLSGFKSCLEYYRLPENSITGEVLPWEPLGPSLKFCLSTPQHCQRTCSSLGCSICPCWKSQRWGQNWSDRFLRCWRHLPGLWESWARLCCPTTIVFISLK